MKTHGVFFALMKTLGMVLLVDLVVIFIILIIGWWAGWQTLVKFRRAVQIAGILVIGIGFMGVKGNRDATRSFEYQSSLATSQKSSWERTQQNLADFARSYAFMLVMFTAGGICLVIGWLL
jgi:hypothetical protein